MSAQTGRLGTCPRQIASIASAWISTDGVAGEAGVTRSPPNSGALLPISTIFPASAARASGSSISLAAEIVGAAG